MKITESLRDIDKRFPWIVNMILSTPSMDDSEREYWLDTLQVITDEQITTLYNILKNEKEKLEYLHSIKNNGMLYSENDWTVNVL